MLIGKKELVKIGFPEDKIVVHEVPITLIDGAIKTAKQHRFDEKFKKDLLSKYTTGLNICYTEEMAKICEDSEDFIRIIE